MALYGGADPFELIKHMTIKEALNFGLTNKEIYNLTKTDKFWRFFLKKDYPYFILQDENPEEAYREIYSNRNVKIMIMYNIPKQKFEDFKYYQNLDSFTCKTHDLTSLRGCPPCKLLDCSNNQLESLQGCPSNVVDLHCYDNQLKSLEGCPESVVNLICFNNKLTSLPDLPPTLYELICYNNPLEYGGLFKLKEIRKYQQENPSPIYLMK